MSIVKFGDIVREVKLNVDRDNNPYEFYVAGEHMDTEDLTIRCKGLFATDDVGPAFTRIFKKGQILYGSRRTYLKKVAVADFDGICSNTTFVLESKNEHVFCQKLLPFIMLTDSFTKWSISHSKGSTNPYILFSDLANYAFELPSLDEQRVLADKLWAAYEVKESYKNLLAQTDKLLHAQFQKMFGKETNIKSWKDVLTIRNGKAYPKEYLEEGPYPIYGSGGVMGYAEDYLFDEDTIIVGRKGNINNPILVREKYWTVDTAFCLDIDKRILNPIYFYNWCQQFDFTYFNKQGVLPSLTRTDLYTIKMPVPPMEKQSEFVHIAEQAEQTKASLNKGIEAIEAVIRSLIAEGTTKV